MKTLILISAIIFTSMGLKANAQCCQPGDQLAKTEKTMQQEPKTVNLKITGMTCAGCSNHISNALKEVDGIIEYNVEYPGDLAIIQYDSSKTNPEAIIKVIEHTGYKAEIIKETQKKKV